MSRTVNVLDWWTDDDGSCESECGMFSISPVGGGYVLTLWLDRNIGTEYGSTSPFGGDGELFDTVDAAKAVAERLATHGGVNVERWRS